MVPPPVAVSRKLLVLFVIAGEMFDAVRANDEVPANCEVFDPVYELKEDVVTNDPVLIVVPAFNAKDAVNANEAVPSNCEVFDPVYELKEDGVTNDPVFTVGPADPDGPGGPCGPAVIISTTSVIG
jgi:hypothetical protein